MKDYYMAIDAGTGSIRTLIFDESFHQIAVAQREWFHKEDPRFQGAIDFDTQENYTLMLETILESIQTSGINPHHIRSISTTSMREAFVLYDASGKEIWAVSNVDARANQEVLALKASSNDLELSVYKITGQTFALGAIPRLLWVKKNLPETFNRIAAFTMLNDWLAYKLSSKFSVEVSNGSTSGLINIHTRQWDKDLIKHFGFNPEIFPQVYESGSPLGKVTSEMAALTGLSEDCLVVVGGGDVQMGCIGLGAVNPSDVSLLGGSFWQLEYNAPQPLIDTKIRTRVNCHADKDLWQQELITFYPGLTLRWFRDSFCRYEKELARSKGISAYEILNDLAAQVPPGANGMLCSFSSIMNYSDWKHPAPCFTNFNINADSYNVGTFYRCLLENAALVTLGHKKIIEDLIGYFPKEITFASGASNSPLWCQIVADVLGVNVKVPVIKEATALGAAFAAAVGAGSLPSFQEAAHQHITFQALYTPDPVNHELYQSIYRKWCAIVASQAQNSAQSFIDYMWKAPGL